MLTSRQKKILFFIYLLLIYITPLVLVIERLTRRSADIFLEVVLLGFGTLMILPFIGKYQWKLMPDKVSKALAWFLVPVLVLVFNFFYFGKEFFLNSLWLDGLAIIASVILAGSLMDFKLELLNGKNAKENLEKFKTPFLYSYWRKKYIRSRSDSVGLFVSILLIILSGIIFYIRQRNISLPSAETTRFIITFSVSVIMNVLAFYKAEFSKYES